MEHPKDIGDRTQLAVMLALRDAGYAVLVPFGENTRYDLVIDDGSRLERVQSKTGRLRKGAVEFKTCSSYAHHSNPAATTRDYLGEVEYFAIHYPQTTSGVYLVPIDDIPVKWHCRLRVDPARNQQRKGIRLAANYLVAEVTVPRYCRT